METAAIASREDEEANIEKINEFIYVTISIEYC